MKRSVVIDDQGTILAIGPASGRIEGQRHAGAPTHHAFLPRAGQHAHEVEFSDEIATVEDLLHVHTTHRVRVVEGRAELEPRPR